MRDNAGKALSWTQPIAALVRWQNISQLQKREYYVNHIESVDFKRQARNDAASHKQSKHYQQVDYG